MGLIVRNIEQAINLYKSKGGRVDFLKDLRKIFEFVKRDSRINDIRELSYLLATAEVESSYGLSRWEADFVCSDSNGISMRGRNYVGVLSNDKPCQAAINYYCSTQGGKQNYCLRELDNRGLPYFGRGLIQLTWKSNYKKYGDLVKRGLGDKLVENPELILSSPRLSYDLAVAFLSQKRSGIYTKNGTPRSTFDLVKDGEMTLARRSVNGGTNGLNTVNTSYDRWLSVFNDPIIDVRLNSRTSFLSDRERLRKIAGYSLIVGSVVGFAFMFYKLTRSK